MAYRKERPCTIRLWDYYIRAVRLWGLITALVLWGIAVETIFRGYVLGWFLLGTAAVVTFLETAYWINIFIILCNRDHLKTFLRLWELVLWLDNWKKGLLYLLLSVECFVEPKLVWLPVISGCMLIVSGLLYIFKTFNATDREAVSERDKEATLDSRFEVPDDLDDGVLDTQSTTPIYSAVGTEEQEPVAEQAEILQV